MNNPDAEDKLLLSKAYDAIELSERIGAPRFLGFLNEHESAYLRDHLTSRADILFYGGYEGAVRLMLGAGAEETDFPIVAIEFRYKEEFDLRHRDFLGSLMGLGIRRDTVGDILTSKGRSVVFAREDVAQFIISQLDKIGRVGVKVGYADPSDLPAQETVKERVITLSSLRLDAFVAHVTNLSREKAVRLIKNEMVTVDHVTRTSADCPLKEGATVTIRKYGKFVLSGTLGESKKGKLRVSVKHY